MEEYLTKDELCDRIKYQRQTVYNLIHRKVFIQGKHFFKPTPKKILFKWSEIQTWIGEDPGSNQGSVLTLPQPVIEKRAPGDGADLLKTKAVSLIRI